MGKFFLWVFIVVIFGYGCYLGIRLMKIYLNYSSLKNESETLLSPGSTTTFNEIPARILEKAQEQKVPLKEQDIKTYIDEWEGYEVFSFAYIDSLMVFDFKTFYFKFSFVDTIFTRSK